MEVQGILLLGVILRTRMQVAGIGPSGGIARGRARSGFVALGVEGKRDSVHPDPSFGSVPEGVSEHFRVSNSGFAKSQLLPVAYVHEGKATFGEHFSQNPLILLHMYSVCAPFFRVEKTFKNPMKMHDFPDQSCAVVPMWTSLFPCQALTKSLPQPSTS